jgi:tetratricopeptide (TPR) repeat protein
MSEHEFWNELGNLYFISGAYEPAIHAYARSIELDHGFGRPYSNMALAFVHIGKYMDAIELYHRSIELLSDDREKAITWNRLGILYRQIKDYHSALVAYEQADKLDSRQDEKREEASRNVKYPLSISMPEIDLKALLAKQEETRPEDEQLVQNLNEELEVAETQLEINWFNDGEFVSPDPTEVPAAEEAALLDDVTLSMEEEGWIPLMFEEAIPVGAPFSTAMQPASEQAEESTSVSNTWQPQFEEGSQENQQTETFAVEVEPAVMDEQTEVVQEQSPEYQRVEVNEYQINNGLLIHADEVDTEAAMDETPLGNQWTEVSGYEVDESPVDSNEKRSEEIDGQPAFENLSTGANEYQIDEQTDTLQAENIQEGVESEIPFEGQSLDVTEPEPMEYSQVEYPLVELSPAEVDSIHIDIARFRRIIQINPRNAFAYDTLGGLYKTLGRFKDAITSYQQAISLDSTKPSYFYQLGLMYSAEHREQEAMDSFQRVLSMNPQHTLANASIGSLYRKMGLHDLAQKHIDVALQNVYEEENEYNQACLEAICGNTDRALELLQVAIEENPSYINWAQHDPDLDVLHHDERFYMLIQSFTENK